MKLTVLPDYGTDDEEAIPLLEKNDDEISPASIASDETKITFSRVPSLGGYYIAFQLFIRLNSLNMLSSADLNNFAALLYILRQTKLFITAETKIAFEMGDEADQRHVFLASYFTTIPTGVLL